MTNDAVRDIGRRFRNVSLKNKIFFSIIAVILIISAAIAMLARWILVDNLIDELELRGIAIARTIAERSSGYILDKNTPELLSLIFDEAKLKERQHLVSYIFVSDREDQVLSHTLTRPFPESLRLANRVPQDAAKSLRLCWIGDEQAYDIAIPVTQGIYRIGTVHVGLNKGHVDQLVGKLRTTFLGFLSLVVVIIFVITHRLANYITMPIAKLTRISEELGKGNFEVKLDLQHGPDGGQPLDCPALANPEVPCRHLDGDPTAGDTAGGAGQSHPVCGGCRFYRRQTADEVGQLSDAFYKMIWNIRLYRRRLRESERKYRSLFDSGPDPIFVINPQSFEIIDANPRAVELYGYSMAELIGMPFTQLAPEHTREYFQALYSQAEIAGLVTYPKALHYKKGRTPFTQLAPEHTREYFQALYSQAEIAGLVTYPKALHYKKGRTPFYVNLHASTITYKGQAAIVLASTDITAMVEKDAQLIQASKMKSLGEMSAGIAHELNQPLNAIKMGSDFLGMMVEAKRDIPPPTLQQVVAEMSSQVDRAAEIINTLRSFGRKAELVAERVDINKPIRAVSSLVRRQFELDNIQLELNLGQLLRPVLAHDNRLQQVFFNLVTNARDAITEKKQRLPDQPAGRIRIRTYQEGDRVMAEVADDGIGIGDAVRDKIFEPFFSTKESSTDMGLGLAITYGIVKDYNGDLLLTSHEGQGTTFTLRFAAA